MKTQKSQKTEEKSSQSRSVNNTIASPCNWQICTWFRILQAHGRIFSRGSEPSLAEQYFDSAQKTAMLTCKIALPKSPHPVTISKSPRFRVHHSSWTEWISFFSLNKYLHNAIFIFGWWFLTEKKLAVARKIVALPESGGCSPLTPGWYAYADCRNGSVNYFCNIRN